jgi:hypothetical protein
LQIEAKAVKKTRNVERKITSENGPKHDEKETPTTLSVPLSLFANFSRVLYALLGALFILSLFELNSPVSKARAKPNLKVAKKEDVIEEDKVAFHLRAATTFHNWIHKASRNCYINICTIVLFFKFSCSCALSTISSVFTCVLGSKSNENTLSSDLLGDDLLLHPKIPVVVNKKSTNQSSMQARQKAHTKISNGVTKVKQTTSVDLCSASVTSASNIAKEAESALTSASTVEAPVTEPNSSLTPVSSDAFLSESDLRYAEVFHDEGEWTVFSASTAKKPKSPKLKSPSDSPNRKPGTVSPKMDQSKVLKAKSLVANKPVPEPNSTARQYDNSKLEVDDNSDGSGSTSEESFEQRDSAQFAAKQQHTLSVNTDQQFTASVSPVPLAQASGSDMHVQLIQWFPGPNGLPAPFVIGPDGMLYPFDPRVYAIPPAMPYFAPSMPLEINEQARASAVQRIASQM